MNPLPVNPSDVSLELKTMLTTLRNIREQASGLRNQINLIETSLIKTLRTSDKSSDEVLSPYLHKTDLPYSSAVKEVAALIIESLPEETDKLSVTEFEGDVILYWKTYHHTCDIFDGEDQTSIRINVRTQTPEGKFESNISVLEGPLDEQCYRAISILKMGLKIS